MPSFQPYTGTKMPEWADQSKSLFPNTPGIFKGEIKKIDGATRSGRLYVYIEGFSTSTSNDPGGWTLVDYASPFAGKTLGPQVNAAPNKQNDFNNTRQTYGFFMTPPDIGNIVLCCFPDGDRTRGFWFACVNPNLGKGMVPSIGAVPLDRIDPVSVPANLAQFLLPGNSYPVGEFNENDINVFSSNWATDTLRPLHIPQFTQLIRQGLQDDQQGRGPVTSSVQRDPVSSVFGFSTPGRATNDPANDPDLQTKINTGEFNPADFVARNRVGGHSLTMDDGDITGKSNLVKLKSAAGHQIFMYDTDGFMYIANAAGTAWVELTKEGDILVFGQRDFSLRTYGNIMMQSKNVSINTGTFNVKAGAVRLETQATIINSEGPVQIQGLTTSIQGRTGVNVIGAQVKMSSVGPISLVGSTIRLNSDAPSLPPQPLVALPQYSLTETLPVGDFGWTVKEGQLTSINYRVPTHEPYLRGNIAAVIAQQAQIISSLTNGINTEQDIAGNPISPATNTTSLNRGIDASANVPITPGKSAPPSTFISQPTPAKPLGNLSQDELRAYFAQTGFTESAGSGGYSAENTLGYQGKYQFGSAALVDLGYVKPGTPQTPEALNNPNNWTGKNGISSAAAFHASPSVQEDAMYNYTKQNYATLQRQKLITDTTDNSTIAGLLSASHLAGPGNVKNWVNSGTDFSDDYGTTLTSYYNQGKYSQTQMPVIQASNESKTVVTVTTTAG